MGSTESQDQKPRLSFASRVRSSDVSFTAGFSPVMHEDDKTKNRFSGLLSGREKSSRSIISKFRQPGSKKTVKTVP
jgi:hypothetical protein